MRARAPTGPCAAAPPRALCRASQQPGGKAADVIIAEGARALLLRPARGRTSGRCATHRPARTRLVAS